MAITVEAVEAGLVAASWPGWAGDSDARIEISGGATSAWASLARYKDASGTDIWWCRWPGGGSYTENGTDGTGRIEVTADGNDVQVVFKVDGSAIKTQTLSGANAYDWKRVWLRQAVSRGFGFGPGAGVYPSRNDGLTVELSNATTVLYPWDAAGELDDWSSATDTLVTGGDLVVDCDGMRLTVNFNISQDFTALPAFGGVSHCLQSPGIMRRVAVDDAGGLSEEFELDGFVAASLPDISGGGYTFPEICYTAATGSGFLAVVLGRSGDLGGGLVEDIAYATSTGVPVSGWSDVQSIRANRTAPCACALPPTHDMYVVALLSAEIASDCIAYGQHLRWNGSSYDIGSETIVVSGDLTVTRGSVEPHPGSRLEYIYVDAAGAVQVKTSTNGGATWG